MSGVFWDIFAFAKRLYARFKRSRMMAIAAGVTFYALLALFPAIAALVSLYGLIADAQVIAAQTQALSGFLPEGAVTIVSEQASRIAAQDGSSLSLSFAIGLAVSLWSANAGMKALFDALNVVDGLPERRGFIQRNALALLFTVGALMILMLALAVAAAIPAILSFISLEGWLEPLLRFAPWPVLLAVMTVSLEMIYRFGPDREPRPLRLYSAGSVMAALVWVAGSLLFSWYVANFGSYNKTYGSLGAVIGFMIWLWLSAIIVLGGAAIEAEREAGGRKGSVFAQHFSL
jgi:membrane protein